MIHNNCKIKLKKKLSESETSNYSKGNILRKCFTLDNGEFSKVLNIKNEESKIEYENLRKNNSFGKKNDCSKNNRIKKEKINYSNYLSVKNNNSNDKKGNNNYILKSAFNPKYNDNINNNNNNNNKFNLLYNYFKNENEELKNNLKKTNKIETEKIEKNKKNYIYINQIINKNNNNKNNINNNMINTINIYNNNINNMDYLIYQNYLQYNLNQQKSLQTLYKEKLMNLKNPKLLIKDQFGCRFLQKVIDYNPEISNILFSLLINEIENMCTDLFGNYVIQKLIDFLNNQNFEKFTLIISKNFKYIASSTYGTRVIQKLIEVISIKNNNFEKGKEQTPIFLKCFSILNSLIINDLNDIFKQNNSSHIIIKFVSVIPYPANDNMYNSIYKHFLILCKDKHGCCVIQKCFENGVNQQKNILFNLTNKYCSELICDQFGNYVIQYVVKCNIELINKTLLNIIMNNLLFLCKEKYASNVLEKFISYNSPESIIFLNEIINDDNIIYNLITNQYGNYIIQRIISCIDVEKRIQIFKNILSWLEDIKNLPFGLKLISKLYEKYKEFNLMVNSFYGKIFSKNNNKNNNYNYNINNQKNYNYNFKKNFENLNVFLMNNYLISPYFINNNKLNINNQNINNHNGMNQLINLTPEFNVYNPNNKKNIYNQNFSNSELNQHF